MIPTRCTIAQAHAITGLSYTVLRDQAARGAIPGASKPAGRWLFVIVDLQSWAARGARDGVPSPSRPNRSPRKVPAGRVARVDRADTARAYEKALQRARRRVD